MLEQTMTYRGLYFVLMGRLSPLDGIGPKEDSLRQARQARVGRHRQEVVLATNFTNEGEATAHYLGQTLKARGLAVTRLARGVPVGGELEYVDTGYDRPCHARPTFDVARRTQPRASQQKHKNEGNS